MKVLLPQPDGPMIAVIVLVDLELDVLYGHVRPVAGTHAVDGEHDVTSLRVLLLPLCDVNRPHGRHRNRLVHLILPAL
jgi:hypothetical protein